MNNNIIMLLRTQRQRMSIFEVEIYIPLTRVKFFFFILFVPVVSKLAVRHCKSERSDVIYSVSIMMCSLLLQRIETKHCDMFGLLRTV